MCIILDTNKYGDFLDHENKDMQPIREWIKRKGKIAYSPTPTFERELSAGMRMQFSVYDEAGKMKNFSIEEVKNEENNLPELESDDPHIIALALVSGVRVLVSMDRDLHTDFKGVVGGKVYQTKSHRRMLRNDTCP